MNIRRALLGAALLLAALTTTAQAHGDGILDSEGVDIWPLVVVAAEKHNIPAVALLALVKAESNLTHHASSNDPAFGYTQVTYATAKRQGVKGDVAAVRAYLHDRENSLDMGARILAYSYHATKGEEAERIFLSMVRYNCGRFPAANDRYWRRWAGNVRRIRAAIAWAYDQAAAQGVVEQNDFRGPSE